MFMSITLRFRPHTAACDWSDAIVPIPNCGFISIDVNGLKPPNVRGKDEFAVTILEDKIIPWGISGTSNTCPGSGNWSGFGCSTKYLYE